MITLNLDGITDANTKDLFESLLKQLNEQPILKGKWQAFDVDLKAGDSNIVHTLKLQPKDLIQTKGPSFIKFISGGWSTFNITVTAAGNYRFFVGQYKE